MFQEVEAEFRGNRHIKVVRLSALNTGRLYPPGRYSWYSFLFETESNTGPSAAGRFTSMKISGDAFRLVAQCVKQMRHRMFIAHLLLAYICSVLRVIQGGSN